MSFVLGEVCVHLGSHWHFHVSCYPSDVEVEKLTSCLSYHHAELLAYGEYSTAWYNGLCTEVGTVVQTDTILAIGIARHSMYDYLHLH